MAQGGISSKYSLLFLLSMKVAAQGEDNLVARGTIAGSELSEYRDGRVDTGSAGRGAIDHEDIEQIRRRISMRRSFEWRRARLSRLRALYIEQIGVSEYRLRCIVLGAGRGRRDHCNRVACVSDVAYLAQGEVRL